MSDATPVPLYCALARTLSALQTSPTRGNLTCGRSHAHRLDVLARLHLPSGAGVDGGMRVDTDASRPERIVLVFSFHHTNEQGSYTHWSENTAVITPSLLFGCDVRITGRSPRGDGGYWKDCMAETLDNCLSSEVDPYPTDV